MYNNDQWKVMGILACDLPKRAVLRTKTIATRFRGDDADRIVRNSFRKLRDEGHIEIVERGEYRLTPAGAKFYSKMVAENFKPVGKRAKAEPKKAAAKKVAKKAAVKKVTKKAAVKKVTKKKVAEKKVAKKATVEAAPKKEAVKATPKKEAVKRKTKVLDAFKSSSKVDAKKEAASAGNGVSEPKPKPAAAATDGLTW